jgi:hypothetical protein
MKVICINARATGVVAKKKAEKKLIEGETYSVLREVSGVDKFNNLHPAYELWEFPGGAWEKSRFIPCSDVDEMELVNEEWNAQECDASKAK